VHVGPFWVSTTTRRRRRGRGRSRQRNKTRLSGFEFLVAVGAAAIIGILFWPVLAGTPDFEKSWLGFLAVVGVGTLVIYILVRVRRKPGILPPVMGTPVDDGWESRRLLLETKAASGEKWAQNQLRGELERRVAHLLRMELDEKARRAEGIPIVITGVPDFPAVVSLLNEACPGIRLERRHEIIDLVAAGESAELVRVDHVSAQEIVRKLVLFGFTVAPLQELPTAGLDDPSSTKEVTASDRKLLKQLEDLHAAGVLSVDEFSSKKANILGRQ
jgi:hypothetical protein